MLMKMIGVTINQTLLNFKNELTEEWKVTKKYKPIFGDIIDINVFKNPSTSEMKKEKLQGRGVLLKNGDLFMVSGNLIHEDIIKIMKLPYDINWNTNIDFLNSYLLVITRNYKTFYIAESYFIKDKSLFNKYVKIIKKKNPFLNLTIEKYTRGKAGSIKENLNESYFDGLYHVSMNSDITKENLKMNITTGANPDKPVGAFWMAKGLSWLKYMRSEGWETSKKGYIYRVKINPKAKILDLKKKKEFAVFLTPKGKKNLKFVKKASESFPIDRIDFDKVKKEFDGIRVYHFGGSSYDVPSVAIWNKNIIQSIELLGKVKDVIKKK